MPGIIMDNANVEGSVRRPGLNEPSNGTTNTLGSHEKAGQLSTSTNGSVHVNGTGRAVDALNQQIILDGTVPAALELPHITQGFFPLGTLINRAVQQCWNGLSDLITELATVQISTEPSPTSMTNGKSLGNQSAENVQKKVQLLQFSHTRRAEFIKLLVLSQWSRQAAEVNRLIDIQGFIRERHQAYTDAIQYVGAMKCQLVRAQMANPDFKTALEVLCKGRVAALPDFGYKAPKPLSARAALKKLEKINRIISIRLAMHDKVPAPLRNYRVHDGRVTFIIPGEFELDLSVAEEANTSQFFFVDIRFSFSPSSPVPKGRIFDELDAKVNEILYKEGLMGCFNFLHGLVLTNKVNTLFRQASDLSRGLWSDVLRIEFLHRTLVVQYWPSRTGPKSWLEIGVQRGQHNSWVDDSNSRVSHLGLRWMRDGRQANNDAIQFDTRILSMERILRSVIALHTSYLLSSAYATLRKNLLFSRNVLSIRAQLSPTEPGECFLNIQMTNSQHLRVSVEPLSGTITLSGVSSMSERPEVERIQHKTAIEELLSRVSRLRCSIAVDEIESGTKALGLESVGQRALGIDVRRLFPSSILRSAFFTHPLWDRRWAAAATSSMDGDSWWLIQLQPAGATGGTPFAVHDVVSSSTVAHTVCHSLMFPTRRLDYTASAELFHGLTGILAIYANARCLTTLPEVHLHPPVEKLYLEADLRVPELFFQYRATALPPSLRITLPSELERESYFQSTFRLAFHGIDRKSQASVLVAHGSLRRPVKSLLSLVSKTDPSILMQNHGGGFALRLLAPAGRSVVLTLFERLQRLECVLSIMRSLIQKQMEPRSLSLSQITFLYGPDKKFSAQFGIDVLGPSPSTYNDISHALSKTESLFQLRLGVSFDSPSPHRRIQEPLAVNLNRRFRETGVESVLASMTETFPLLQCLDRITNPTQLESPILHVTVRSPTAFQFHYPLLRARFRLSIRLKQGRTVWLLEDATQTPLADQSQVYATVRKKIYNSKGNGWQGLADGAVSAPDTVGNLLTELHGCLGACQPESNEQEGGKLHEQPGLVDQRSVAPGAQPPKPSPQQPLELGNADIITID